MRICPIAVKAILSAQEAAKARLGGRSGLPGLSTRHFEATQFAVMASLSASIREVPTRFQALGHAAYHSLLPRPSQPTIFLFFWSSSTSIGTWLPSQCCVKFAMFWQRAINHLHVKPQPAR